MQSSRHPTASPHYSRCYPHLALRVCTVVLPLAACMAHDLIQEVELLTLYKAMVDNGPDLFSLHRVSIEAPFR